MPRGWQVLRFGDIAEIANGQVQPTKEPYASYLHIGPENIESGSGRLRDLKTASEDGLISGKYLFDENSVVYSKVRPNLNKVCRPDFVGICSADAYPVWPITGLLTKDFLYYVMSSPGFVRQATEVSSRSGMPKINRRDLALVRVLVPPVQEQEKIVHTLEVWDRACTHLSGLIKAQKTLGQALVTSLIAETNKATSRGSLLQKRKLGDFFTHRKERGRAGLPLLSVTISAGIVQRRSLGRKVGSELPPDHHLLAQEGDLIYNMMRTWQGALGVSSGPGLVSPAYVVCAPRPGVESKYFARLLKSHHMLKKVRDYSSGLTDDRLRLYFHDFSVIPVEVPDYIEQRRIAEVLDAIDQQIDLMKRQADALARQKKGLMEKLLTGKIRVKA
ncbi:MAG: restriction endonuclease subunit S [Candidatus Methylomirabilia bacterium]